MKGQSTGPSLSALFVDYDNIYLSLKRKNEEAAKRFAKDSALWLREIESGRLITPTNGLPAIATRRLVMNRCYGNPVPRRNTSDNSTDMNSFPFVRHHFLRAGFEVVDCPPLTAQLKNSADIRMVLDVLEHLGHNTYFDEFIILSGDADFTPVLHKLRAHARRTVVFANDHTAQPYTAISDGEVRESDLISLLLEGRIPSEAEPNNAALPAPAVTAAQLETLRKEIVAEVIASVRAASQPVPLEALADRAVRSLGHDKTVGSSWGGAGSFRDLLLKALPEEMRLSDQPPYYVFDTSRQIAASPPERRIDVRAPERLASEPIVERETARHIEAPRSERLAAELPPPVQTPLQPSHGAPAPALAQMALPPQQPAAAQPQPTATAAPRQAPAQTAAPTQGYTPTRPPATPAFEPQQPAAAQPRAPLMPPPVREPLAQQQVQPQPQLPPQAPPQAQQPAPQQAPLAPPARTSEAVNAQIHQSIARIHDACQAPPLSPPDYRVLFEAMAEEINANNLSGRQTLVNIQARAREHGVDIRGEDIRFVLEVVSEADPWFEQGASANLFASRFRNFVVARCRSQGLALSSDELDLIEAWFGGSPAATRAYAPSQSRAPAPAQREPQPQQTAAPRQETASGDRWWSLDEGREHVAGSRAAASGPEIDDEFPRIIRTRLRG